MKKLLAVTLLGAAVAGTVVVAKGAGAPATPEAKTCAKLKDLCSVDDTSRIDVEKCEADLKKTEKLVGEPSVQRSMKCIDESKSCMAASGCMMGGVGMGALGEMMKGFGTAISQ
jgi:hypothetical protein